MIILGWIGMVLLIICLCALLIYMDGYESYWDSFVRVTYLASYFIAFTSVVCLIVFLIAGLIFSTLKEPVRTPKPTILSCNGVTVAESVDGFAFNSKSGTYEDYHSSLTYTPRQGEACKQYLKGE